MSDELLPYYNRELTFIRRLGAEFAAANPKIAARLQLGADSAEDPHVERLIEAFAYLNARIRHKLDDDFPEISDAMLGVLYPHYQAPIPSMAIVQFALDRGEAEAAAGFTAPQGTVLETDTIEGEPCRFRTCYPVTVWPMELTAANLMARPFRAPQTRFSASAEAVLRLELQGFSREFSLANLRLSQLRFFLKGQPQHVFPLYELLFCQTLGVAIASPAEHAAPLLLERNCLRPVGFDRDQGLLPYTARSFLGYRLLTEYFCFPAKYLFFDMAGVDLARLPQLKDRLEIYIYLGQSTRDLEQNISTEMFRMGCTPVVNLFPQAAEPTLITHTESSYRIVPDARRPLANEIYSVDRVVATSPENEEVEHQPFYSFQHTADREQQAAFWHAVRRPAEQAGGQVDHGTEMYLSLLDLNFSPALPANWTLHVETTCLNRDLPHRLPFGGGQPILHLTTGAPISRIECLTRPTPTLRPALKHGAVWRLISHLSLNHLSLVGGPEAAESLREILRLYDFGDSAQTRSMIDGVLDVRSQRVVGRCSRGSRSGFCRGLEVAVHLDEQRFVGSGVLLFSIILERFLGLYCSINSFSKLVVTTNQREDALWRGAPWAGETILL